MSISSSSETRKDPEIGSPVSAAPNASKRLLSIDALRGFDMLLIAGGGTFLVLLKGKTGIGAIDWIANQLTHPAWDGFTFYDFIFPLFLFIAGVSLTFSLNKGKSLGLSKPTLYRKTFVRMIVLILLGMLYKNAPVPFFEPSQIRLGSVLGRIGLATFVATWFYLNMDFYKRLASGMTILLLYYAALYLIPVPGYGAGDLSFEGNLVGWFDRTFLPGRLHQVTYDELGLLTQFPALCLTLFGTLAGEIIGKAWLDKRKGSYLAIGGVAGIALGLLWGLHFPINKHLWSSSFILLTTGMAFLFLLAFYWVIDVWKIRKWAFFFQVIGLNSLTIYFAYSFIDFGFTSRKLFYGLYTPLPEEWHAVFQAFGAFLLVWIFLYILYRLKLFVKV
ncbi:acyltransferase family protein [Cyclobacterium xiamenense]|uniref:acyltransferase family protein n=1 Tax=Cyclobacterium xiamenense TaxID=1297121 RepID=UPI0035D0BA66